MPAADLSDSTSIAAVSGRSLSSFVFTDALLPAADLLDFSNMLTALFPQLRQRLAIATADPELLYQFWLLVRMPVEFRLPVLWQSVHEQSYREIVAQIPLAPDVLFALPPFINAVVHCEPWLREQADLRTLDGVGFLVEWIYKNCLTADIALPQSVEAELCQWANAEQDSLAMPGLTRLMYLIWNRRADLRAAYDVRNPKQRQRFIRWFAKNAASEYGFCAKIVESAAGKQAGAPTFKSAVGSLLSIFRKTAKAPSSGSMERAAAGADGKLSVVGSFGGEFGVGQHARSVIESMDAVQLPVAMLNSRLGPHDHSNSRYADRFAKGAAGSINLLCLNVMSGLEAVRDVGAANMLGRYNILYGYWELSTCPRSWSPYLDLYDEFWAPTKFIADALRGSTARPVLHMPIAVTIEQTPAMTRVELGLPTDKYLFLFHFDGHSFPSRKNAEAAIGSFKQAFSDRAEPVALIIKTKHLPPAIAASLTELVAGDERIIFLEGDFPRRQIIALEQACDAYISLHRAEGFGMGPAEMMCMGKPVIVTNYSGNTDFTNEQNSCLVDYQLVPVQAGQYAFFESGQMWADPDVEQAAHYMRKLSRDSAFAAELGAAARQYMEAHHNPQVVGRRYRRRLAELAV